MKTNWLSYGLFLAAAGVLLLSVGGCSTPSTTIVIDPVAKAPDQYNKIFDKRGNAKGATLILYVPREGTEYKKDEDEALTCNDTINVDDPSQSAKSNEPLVKKHGHVRTAADDQLNPPVVQPNHPGPHYIVIAFKSDSETTALGFSAGVKRGKLPMVIIRTKPVPGKKPGPVDDEDEVIIQGTGTHSKKPRVILDFPGGFPEGEQGNPKIFQVHNKP